MTEDQIRLYAAARIQVHPDVRLSSFTEQQGFRNRIGLLASVTNGPRSYVTLPATLDGSPFPQQFIERAVLNIARQSKTARLSSTFGSQ